MYAGTVSNFFYKPKDWITKQPLFVQKDKNITFLNMSGKVLKFNDTNGKTILNEEGQKDHKPTLILNKYNRLNTINRPNFYRIKRNLINQNYTHFISKNDNHISLSERKYMNQQNGRSKELFNDIYFNNMDNNHSIQNEYSKTIDNNRFRDYMESNDFKSSPKVNSFDSLIYSNLFNLSTNSNTLKASKEQEILKKDNDRYCKTILYFNKTNKKHFKPFIAFGHKMPRSLNVKNNKKAINTKQDFSKNSLFLLYRQHHNNMLLDGDINDKIYDNANDNNIIIKTFKDQILKDKIKNKFQKEFHFYDNKKSKGLKVPTITYKNYEFYKGYTFSNKRKEPIHHKLFFNYINKQKMNEKKEVEKYLNNF
jgi:hypothetical protein